MRAAARRSRENAVRHANGETGVSSVGELSESRMEALEEINPGWARYIKGVLAGVETVTSGLV
ncbi:hypothetical protein [Streptomyces sp. NRRL B-24085]|uniref:hypothetical protein n=1 Tax=Streptomyces sp. NRRL B-24085 TaxID=1709476 RepID=UPI000A396DA3|nr:hypothetical protein [Streptomyces sp. NRRL B-24085]